MRLSLEARGRPARIMLWASPLIAAVASVIGVSVLFAVLGRPPLTALYVLFVAPLESLDGLAELALKATPLLLIAVGIAGVSEGPAGTAIPARGRRAAPSL